MTLAEGVPPNDQAATTDLGDATYQHDDHHRDLAAVADAYLEFLADTQTPYFFQVLNGTGNYFTQSNHQTDYIAEGSQFLTPPLPARPLGALTDPFIGPGIVTDPIGYNPDDQYYTGPGAFRALKTGVISVQWSLITADLAGAEGSRVRMSFHGEDGVNQNYASGSAPSTGGAVGPSTSSAHTGFQGFALLTISEFDRLDDLPYSVQFPSVTSPNYPGQYAIDSGMMPLGWDIYPWFTIENHAVNLTGITIDHLTMLIRKIA